MSVYTACNYIHCPDTNTSITPPLTVKMAVLVLRYKIIRSILLRRTWSRTVT